MNQDSNDLLPNANWQTQQRGTNEAHVYGFRFGFLSWYENIISVKQVQRVSSSEGWD